MNHVIYYPNSRDYLPRLLLLQQHAAPSFVFGTAAMVFHRDPLGIASCVSVYILLVFGDYATVYYVLEYGKHEGCAAEWEWGGWLVILFNAHVT